jgi:hypothetical protein
MDAPQDVFPDEEICEQAKGNTSATLLAMLVTARERRESLVDAAGAIGRIFAPSWDAEQGKGAREIARWAALNALTCGAELRRLEGDASRAEAIVAGWPGPDDLAYFGLTQAEADALNELYGPIAERLGLRYSWRREGDQIVMTFAKTEP